MNLTQILHALLFTSAKPLATAELTQLVRKGAAQVPFPELEAVSEEEVANALCSLAEEMKEKSIFLQEIAEGWRYATHPQCSPWIHLLHGQPRTTRLSQPALETLAIIAYRQPISRAQIEWVRGVGIGGVLDTLTERQLIEVSGRSEVPGRPLLYSTTSLFLEYFGLRDLNELPNAHELRQNPTQDSQVSLQPASSSQDTLSN